MFKSGVIEGEIFVSLFFDNFWDGFFFQIYIVYLLSITLVLYQYLHFVVYFSRPKNDGSNNIFFLEIK